MRKIIGNLIIVISIIGGAYIGLWLMFIKPIIDCCMMFDNGTLTAVAVGVCIIKCIFASFVGGLIAYIGAAFGIVVKNK